MILKKRFFTVEEKKRMVQAIADAEEMTSGEIRVHVEAKCKAENVLHRAMEVFYKLGMDKTSHANAVLIYLAHDSKKFAIIGDKGINEVVPANFWDGAKEVMREHFKRGEFVEGIIFAITEAGSHLKQYFPHAEGKKNELSNEISEE